MDSGAGVSIIDTKTLDDLKICCKLESKRKQLFDASGNIMDIIGTTPLKIYIPKTGKGYTHVFYVLRSNYTTKILLGRDIMEKFGVITFDFTNNRAKLGTTWINGVGIFNEKELRLSSQTTIPPRSENIFTVRCSTDLAFVPLDFEPRKLPGVPGVYISRSRVIPSVDGDVSLSILNVTEKEVELRSRTRIGKITKPCEILNSIQNTIDDSKHKANETVTNDVHIDDTLPESQILAIQELLKKYRDVFAMNPKKPNRVNVLEHKIITETENPVFQKPRKIPYAWNKEVNKQIN